MVDQEPGPSKADWASLVLLVLLVLSIVGIVMMHFSDRQERQPDQPEWPITTAPSVGGVGCEPGMCHYSPPPVVPNDDVCVLTSDALGAQSGVVVACTPADFNWLCDDMRHGSPRSNPANLPVTWAKVEYETTQHPDPVLVCAISSDQTR